jgi:hypothetical protein
LRALRERGKDNAIRLVAPKYNNSLAIISANRPYLDVARATGYTDSLSRSATRSLFHLPKPVEAADLEMELFGSESFFGGCARDEDEEWGRGLSPLVLAEAEFECYAHHYYRDPSDPHLPTMTNSLIQQLFAQDLLNYVFTMIRADGDNYHRISVPTPAFLTSSTTTPPELKLKIDADGMRYNQVGGNLLVNHLLAQLQSLT